METSALSQELHTPSWSRKLDASDKVSAMAKYVKELGIHPSEVFASMLRVEREHTFYTKPHPYLKYRRIVSDWIIEIGDYFNMQRTTTYSAIYLLDRIKPDDRFKRFQWQLVAVCCFLLAAKYNECEEDIPALPKLEEITQESLPNKLILNYEIWILDRIDWDVTTYTPLHFIDYFLLQSCALSHIASSGRGSPYSSQGGVGSDAITPIQIRACAELLAHHCMRDYTFKSFRSSIVAAAILFVARKRLAIFPVWSSELLSLTTYSEHDLKEAVLAIDNSYTQSADASTPFHSEPHASTPTSHKSHDDDTDYTSPRAVADVA